MTVRGSVLGLVFVVSACTPTAQPRNSKVTAKTHTWFPVSEGVHAVGSVIGANEAISCESCHLPTTETFTEVSCLGCHAHEAGVTALLHRTVQGYEYASPGCYACHPAGEKVPFDHAGIQTGCATCHATGAPFAALPVANVTHVEIGATDCSACHATGGWKGALSGGPAGLSHDPANDVSVEALSPRYAGTSLVALTPNSQRLPMEMSHTSLSVAAAAFGACTNCHVNANDGQFFGGRLHASLSTLLLGAPTQCADCHVKAAPTGFVGQYVSTPPRNPTSGSMKHDAVVWVNDTPTTTALVTADCATCHTSPTFTSSTWFLTSDGGAPRYHAALAQQGVPAPTSCIDCHASSRPSAALPSSAGVAFDHQNPAALGDCVGCHSSSTSWSGASFHTVAAPNAGCATCHEAQRPTSTAAWLSTTWQATPFDAVTNSAGIAHGAARDCSVCHADFKTWVGGVFVHGPGTLSASGCIACHTTQRPDLALSATKTPAQVAALIGFDHATNGRGECFACHQATANANRYSKYFNPSGSLPGGDWRDGGVYPGEVFAASQDQFITVTELTLNRSGPNDLVTSMTSKAGVPYFNGMLHVSAQVPGALNGGPSNNPNYATCWHCHTNTAGVVTAYSGGLFHASLTAYTATVGGPKTPFPQPTSCGDCHKDMRPLGLVEPSDAGVATRSLQSMDHSARFTAPVMLGGTLASGVSDLDCAVCHSNAGKSWGDGLFHSKIAAAVPTDCTSCHYPLMAEPDKADLRGATGALMSHRSSLITFQNCQTCHASALAKSTTLPLSAKLFDPGRFHSNLTAQPATCLECHSGSTPTMSTPGSAQYNLALGATSTNQPQYMNHADPSVVGRDCSVCHAADAKKTGAVWSTSSAFHATTAAVSSCQGCHGLTNGLGSVIGTKNNLPLGLTNSKTVTTAANTASTGVAAGTLDQLTHADLNVSSRDCSACHTQVGPSTTGGIAGKEWSLAAFHSSLSPQNPLVANLTTARCSNCHLNVKPGPAYPRQDHGAFTSVSGTPDCTPCHVYPGTGTAASPNWLGASGVPTSILVGGFLVPSPPAPNATTTQAGIAGLPHPTVGTQSCSACHAQPNGGTGALGYDHASTLIRGKCNACHEAGSHLVGTTWNGATTAAAGGGDTRPITLPTVNATFSGNTKTITSPNHFYAIDCGQCHVPSAGNALVTTGPAYRSAWSFQHRSQCPTMTNPSTCNACHPGKHSKCD